MRKPFVQPKGKNVYWIKAMRIQDGRDKESWLLVQYLKTNKVT